MELQEEGFYPAAFTVAHEPLFMLHGDYDPYPRRMTRANLKQYLPQLEYRE